MEKNNGNGAPGQEAKSESDTTGKSKDHLGHHAPAADDAHKTPKKRRKVNHACVYCRRSHMTCDLERPCLRCIKRNIGHLCHDEPRDPESKKSKSVIGASTADDSETQSELARNSLDQTATSMGPPSFDGSLTAAAGQARKATFDVAALGQGNPLQLVQPTPVSGIRGTALTSSMNQFAGFSDAWLTAQNHFHEMHNYHPNYMIAPEVSNEFNLLNDFLHTSLLDEGALLPDEQNQLLAQNQANLVADLVNPNNESNNSNNGNNNKNSTNKSSSRNNGTLLPPSAMPGGAMLPPSADQAKSISRPPSVIPVDKAREYYLQAADPSGNDTPEQRMQRLLQAKYDAGLLKPFNYIKGYSRLSTYLDGHVAASSKQKILRQLDKFRPKFREKIQTLTDIDLVVVEMWFEKTLMEYDRVFASMAVPACCWRRTGEIFRGNKEMAELINVPVEMLRDGKIALHEILTEDSVVRYWEEFGTIAFDPDHDTLLTACSLKSPDDKSKDPVINCCFSFMIRRDDYKIPSLIVGNFLPHDPKAGH